MQKQRSEQSGRFCDVLLGTLRKYVTSKQMKAMGNGILTVLLVRKIL